MPKFNLGRIVMTPAARDIMLENNVDPMTLLLRHANGDWGDTLPGDVKENEFSIDKELRIWSVYVVGSERLSVITEADRSSTCILLSSEY